MGVPAFYRCLTEKYPMVVVDMVQEEAIEIVGIRVPVNTSKPNPNGLEFDNLYLDMKGVIHPFFHPEDRVKPKGVTMTVLLAKAAAMALAQHPVVNSSPGNLIGRGVVEYCDSGPPALQLLPISYAISYDSGSYCQQAKNCISLGGPHAGIVIEETISPRHSVTDSALKFGLFFLLYLFHILFCVFSVVAPSLVFEEKSLAIWVIEQVYMYFRGNGKTAEMKRDATRGAMRAVF